MIFTMNSKVFFKEFLENETDKDILRAQYVVVSTRIRKTSNDKKYDNVVIATNFLFPDTIGIDEEHFEYNYYDQLSRNNPFFATLILGVIEKDFNIIFLCSKSEDKLHYLDTLSRYIMEEFNFPVYNYHKLRNCKIGLIDYDKKEVTKYCKKILKEASDERERMRDYSYNSKSAKKKISSEFKKLSKKQMKKELLKRNIYTDGMSKKDMLEVYMLFVD